MLATKRYEYIEFDKILIHPNIRNHRPLNLRKVDHYQADILKNGLLEPLIVWEKKPGEYFLVGGFHRMAAIRAIRQENPGYYDRVDVRVVGGELDEIMALNLKLNADRLDTKVSDYFDVIIYLNNANWECERISAFIDRSVSWVEDIIRYVPGMDPRLRNMLAEGNVSWNRTKAICRAVMDAPAGEEKAVLERELQALSGNGAKPATVTRPLTFRSAKKRVSATIKRQPEQTYTVRGEDLLSLLLVLEGKKFEPAHIEQVKHVFPGLLEDGEGPAKG